MSADLLSLAVERGLLSAEQAASARGLSPDEIVARGLVDRREMDLLLRLAGTPRTLFDRYEVIEELGRGGMGVVYKCRDRHLDRLVALKGVMDAFGDLERFEREARTAARLRHPNIVKVFDFGRRGGQAYLTMEIVEGRTLGALIEAQLLDRTTVVQVIRQVAEALHYAHRRHVVHRDVKPENIIVDDAGAAHLTDFGLAKRVEGDARITVSGMIMGTPAYMSPEQASGKAVDHRSDIYNLGATLYFALTRRLPHDGATPMEAVMAVMSADPPHPRDLDPTIAPDLDTVCMKALARDPERRYPRAKEFATDLRRYLLGETILARRPSRLYRFANVVRRHKALSAALVALAVVALAYAVTVPVQWRRQEEQLLVSELWRDVEVAHQGIYHRHRDPSAMRAELRAAADRATGLLPAGRSVRARAYFYLGDLDAAEADLADDPAGRPLLGRVLLEQYARRRDPALLAEAGRLLESATTRDDRAAQAVAEALGSSDPATALSAMAPTEETCYWLGELAATPDECIRFQTEALAIAPHLAKAYESRARARRRIGDEAGADEDERRAQALSCS